MNYKILGFSLVAVLTLHASEVNLDNITVVEKIDSIKLKNISGEELKSADLGEALAKKAPSIEISRRSGIANDIILRGQKRDNINVIIDGGKIYGGCPNRMDPPISHVLTSNIESVKVDEGPYDVEDFGTLSGVVKVKTKEPKKVFKGEANLNIGSFGYKKGSLTLSGGNDKVKALLTISKEKSEQYKDGNADAFQEQLKKSGSQAKYLYKDSFTDLDSFTKKSIMTKLYFTISPNQKLKLSYTANRSKDVLYPNSSMDAIKDDSDLYNINWSIANLGEFSKKLEFIGYYSKVVHPMSNKYRNSSNGMAKEIVNDMLSKISGLRIKNSFYHDGALWSFGLDGSKRTWDGTYYKKTSTFWRKSIDNSVTKDKAIFAKVSKKLANHQLEMGTRYDKVNITNDANLNKPSFNYLSASLFDTIMIDKQTKLFWGVGKSSRVPDGRELYFVDKATGNVVGTPTLKKTTNTEFDLGVKKQFDSSNFKAKAFYSKLKDFIYFDKRDTKNNFVNIDAKIYGVELSGGWLASDMLSFEYGLSYTKGTKDKPLAGQSDKDLADISPLKLRLATNYFVNDSTDISLEMIAKSRWKNYDKDNGEQEIAGYGVLNLKVNKEISNKLKLTFGVDNLFDKTYSTSNTYNDLSLVVAGGSKKVKLNDPGRYMYLNANYSF